MLFEGQITATEIADEESFAFGMGTHRMKGLRHHEGHTLSIWYKNEYHVSWLDDKPFVTSPDCLIIVNRDTGEPAISYDFHVGDDRAQGARSTPRGTGHPGLGPAPFRIRHRLRSHRAKSEGVQPLS